MNGWKELSLHTTAVYLVPTHAVFGVLPSTRPFLIRIPQAHINHLPITIQLQNPEKNSKIQKKAPKSIRFAFFFQSFFLSCVIMEDHQKQQHQHDVGHSSDSDTTSSSSSSSDSDSGKGLYSMSDIMEHLPVKKGLSKHFQGKSQSFTSLSNARTLEDLAKPQSKRKLSLFYRNRVKPVNSCSRIISKKPSLLMGHHHHHHHPQTHHHHPQTAEQLSPTIHFCN